jgi:hypothetical protein
MATFTIGIIIGLALLYLVFWLNSKKIAVKWYEWLIGASGLLILVWAVHDFFASMAEHNETAALTFLWILGIPAFVLLVLPTFLAWKRYMRAKRIQHVS